MLRKNESERERKWDRKRKREIKRDIERVKISRDRMWGREWKERNYRQRKQKDSGKREK